MWLSEMLLWQTWRNMFVNSNPLPIMALCSGRSPRSLVEETMRCLVDKPPFRVRVSIPVAMDTKCALSCIWTEMAWVEEHISRYSSLSCAVSLTRYSAGRSHTRLPLCCWIRITWNTWSTPSGLIRAAPPFKDQDESQTLPVDVHCSALCPI